MGFASKLFICLVADFVGRIVSNAAISPFKITSDSAPLQVLQQRLDSVTWPTEVADALTDDWRSGVPLGAMQELVNYLKNEYNFTEQVEKMNEYPQFIAEVDGLDLHFIHQKSSHIHAMPLMFVHGTFHTTQIQTQTQTPSSSEALLFCLAQQLNSLILDSFIALQDGLAVSLNARN